MGGTPPRIAPGTLREIGPLNALIARAIGVATRSGPPNIFTTLARHRRLFRRWLRFAGALMPGGRLPRVDTELLILRVAHNLSLWPAKAPGPERRPARGDRR